MRNKIIVGIVLLANLSFSYTPNSTREINKITNKKVNVFRESFEDNETNRSLINIKFDFKNGDFYEKSELRDGNSGFRFETLRIKKKIYKFRIYSFRNRYVGARIVGYEDSKTNVLYKHWISDYDSEGYESKIEKEMTARNHYINGLSEMFLIDPHSKKNDKKVTWVQFDDYSRNYQKLYEKLMKELKERNKEIDLENLENEVLKKPSLSRLKSETN